MLKAMVLSTYLCASTLISQPMTPALPTGDLVFETEVLSESPATHSLMVGKEYLEARIKSTADDHVFMQRLSIVDRMEHGTIVEGRFRSEALKDQLYRADLNRLELIISLKRQVLFAVDPRESAIILDLKPLMDQLARGEAVEVTLPTTDIRVHLRLNNP